ncbi:MAG: 4Fe-4S binding protein [Desulfovibrionaceae bacterium]|nr:4Fe-4S binding protein [Desulfovibrionaceae bacterium]
MVKPDFNVLKRHCFMLQQNKKTVSIRIHIVGGRVTADQLENAAAASRKYGRGFVHLTSRQSIEIPHIPVETIDEVREFLHKGDNVPGICGPGLRTITACQGSEVCGSGCIETYALARELDKRYFDRELPHKLKIGITGCPNNCLKTEENDIGIKGAWKCRWKKDSCIRCGLCVKACKKQALTLTDQGTIQRNSRKCNLCGRCAKVCPKRAYDVTQGWIVSFGGTFGTRIIKGKSIIPFISEHDALLAVCDATVSFFAEEAKPKERLAGTIERIGKSAFTQKIRAAYENSRKASD